MLFTVKSSTSSSVFYALNRIDTFELQRDFIVSHTLIVLEHFATHQLHFSYYPHISSMTANFDHTTKRCPRHTWHEILPHPILQCPHCIAWVWMNQGRPAHSLLLSFANFVSHLRYSSESEHDVCNILSVDLFYL